MTGIRARINHFVAEVLDTLQDLDERATETVFVAIENNPEWLRQYCDFAAESAATNAEIGRAVRTNLDVEIQWTPDGDVRKDSARSQLVGAVTLFDM